MSKPLRLVGSVLPLIFGTLAFSFIVTSFVSRDWVRQNYFPHNLQPLDWKNPSYTLYRSPFIVCGINTSKPDSNTTQYDLSCQRFKPFGRGQTACQTPNETDSYTAVTGDWRMCQQVSLSGNLILASLVFTCLAFVIVLPLCFVFVRQAASTGANSGIQGAAEDGDTTDEARNHHHHHNHHDKSSQQQKIRSPIIITATYALIIALSVAAVCAVLSQFYSILGLVQSQPDNGSWASLTLGQVQDSQTGDLSHAPWIQGKVLTTYISLGWFFSALTAGAIGASWLGNF
jgi:hypothetical protein